jgi:cell division septum initiation protein DivIVA
MYDQKKTRDEIAEKLDQAGDAVTSAAQTVTELARETARKAAPVVRSAAEKATPVVLSAAEKAGNTIRKSKQKAAALVPEIYVQWDTSEVRCAEILDRARKDYKSKHRKAICSCKVYIKPQDGVAYYVINDTEGKIAL